MNIDKTVCIPLWPKGQEEIKDSIAQTVPSWTSICVDTKGTYLGFVIGPGSKNASWTKPLAKYVSRVNTWSRCGGGSQFAALAYNVFALSTLLYVGQLERIPEDVIAQERKQVCRMFPGPGHWLEPEDAWFMAENFGCAKSPQPLAIIVSAAQLRVASLGCHFSHKHITPARLRRQASDNIFARAESLNLCKQNSDFLGRIVTWNDWYNNNYCQILCDNANLLKTKGIQPGDIYQSIANKHFSLWDSDDMKKIRSQFQKTVVAKLKSVSAPNAQARLRHKVRRWHGIPYGLQGLPANTCGQIHEHLSALSKLVAPRVHSAVFHTIFNGWCTHRRFQRRHSKSNLCVFKCNSSAEDSIEHYCRCEVVRKVAAHTFHMSYNCEHALDLWALSSKALDNQDHLHSIGLLIYGVYNAFNSIRNGHITNAQQAFYAIVQHCKQGAMGHPRSMTHIDSRWHTAQSVII